MRGESEIMDVQSVTLLPFNRVNYILSVAGAISAGDSNCLGIFICIGSKFMKFQWTLICLHWFILTADLWNFNFLFILRLLEMESLSDNWLQWMEMIWSVVKQMRFAMRGLAVNITTWFETISTSACVFFFVFFQHWNIHREALTWMFCTSQYWILTPPSNSLVIFLLSTPPIKNTGQTSV